MSDRRNTNKITSLTVGQARELVGRGRKLYLDGVESLTAEVARVLAGNECRFFAEWTFGIFRDFSGRVAAA